MVEEQIFCLMKFLNEKLYIMKAFKIFLIFFPFFSLPLLAQSDFRLGSIVTNKGDTVHGLIDYQADYKLQATCRFKTADKESIDNYKASDIKGFRFDKEQRIFFTDSVKVDGNYHLIFLEIILEGKLSLYKFVETTLVDYFFIKRSGEKFLSYIPFKKYYEKTTSDHGLSTYIQTIEHTSTNHIDTLKKCMSDAPSIYREIEKVKEPTEASLIKILKLYHEKICYKNVCITHQKQKQPLQVFVTPTLEYICNRNELYDGNDLYKGITASIGILKSNERLFLKTGFLLAKNNSKIQTDQNYFYVIPLQLEYRFPKRMIQPIVNYGLNYNSIYDMFVPVLSTNVDIWFSKHIAVTAGTEFYFEPFVPFPVVPKGFISYSFFAGLQIKL